MHSSGRIIELQLRCPNRLRHRRDKAICGCVGWDVPCIPALTARHFKHEHKSDYAQKYGPIVRFRRNKKDNNLVQMCPLNHIFAESKGAAAELGWPDPLVDAQ